MKKLKLSIILLLVFSLVACYPKTTDNNSESDINDPDQPGKVVLTKAEEI